MSDFITGKGKVWSPSYLFISRSHVLLRLMFRFLGYKYQRPDYCTAPATNLKSRTKSRSRQDLRLISTFGLLVSIVTIHI